MEEKTSSGRRVPRGPKASKGPSGSLGQAYNVDSVTWDAANSRYVIKLTGITYTHTTYVTMVTAVDSAYTATYGADSGNLLVYLRNPAGVKQKAHFSFVVLKAS